MSLLFCRVRGPWHRVRYPLIAALMMASGAPASAQTPELALEGREIALEELLAFAAQHSPRLGAAAAARGYGEAAELAAGPLFPANPVLEIAGGPRREGNGAASYDFVAGISQPVGLFGQRGAAREAAGQLSASLAARAAQVAWQMRRDVTRAFRKGQLLRTRLALAAASAALAKELHAAVRRRHEAGATSALDVHLAAAELAQADEAVLTARSALGRAGQTLCELSGWPPETPLLPLGDLEAPRPLPPLAAGFERSGVTHPDLVALGAEAAEAQARAEWARRESLPVPALGVTFTREGAGAAPPEYIVLGTVGLELPLWRRNRGEVAGALTDAAVSLAERDARSARLRNAAVRAHAAAAHALDRIESAGRAARILEDSLALQQRGFAAGEFSFLEVAYAQGRLLKARERVLDAREDYEMALAELETALGSPVPVMPVPGTPTGGAP